jgi:hypothetical protein
MSRNQQHTSIDLTTLYLKKSITIRIWVSQYQTIWNGHHINNICKKASSTVGFIRHNLKGTTIYHLTWRGGGMFFFSKKIFWFSMLLKKIFWFWWRIKKNLILFATKKINILTLVLSGKKILKETKNHKDCSFTSENLIWWQITDDTY